MRGNDRREGWLAAVQCRSCNEFGANSSKMGDSSPTVMPNLNQREVLKLNSVTMRVGDQLPVAPMQSVNRTYQPKFRCGALGTCTHFVVCQLVELKKHKSVSDGEPLLP